MRRNNASRLGIALIVCAAAGGALQAGQQGQAPSQFPLSNAIRPTGQSVTPAFEGWFYDRDGGIRLLIGYFNRNTKQELDIPIGPNNHVEPGGPDQGQPTHFLTGRQFGVFAIKVPKDFGTKQLTWTLTVNGQTNVIPMHIKPDWVVEPYEDAGSKNTPPVLRFQADGARFSGPPSGLAATLTTTWPLPVTLPAWVTDELPKLNVAPRRAPRTRTRRRRPRSSPAHDRLEQVSRTRTGDVRIGEAGHRQGRRRKGDDHRHVQRARRVRPAGAGKRSVR